MRYKKLPASVVVGLPVALLGYMRIALPIWNGNVSPVLDVARELLVVDCTPEGERVHSRFSLAELDICHRANMICSLHPDTLICGALSRPLELALSGAGIRMETHICGPADQIVEMFFAGKLTEQSFRMPGCCGRRGRNRGAGPGGRGIKQSGAGKEIPGEVDQMPGGDGTGPAGGAGGGRRRGRSKAGPAGNCVCPSCGRKVPHVQGQPCNRMACPDCGTPLVRQ